MGRNCSDAKIAIKLVRTSLSGPILIILNNKRQAKIQIIRQQVIISEHRHPAFRSKIRSVFRSITTQNMVKMA